jgi:hypothetical protein
MRHAQEVTMLPPGDSPWEPWKWNIGFEAYLYVWIALIAVSTFLAAWMGRDRKRLPNDLGRNVEEFAGIQHESNGPVPIFLLIFYGWVALGIVGYIIITIAQGYNY